MVDIQALQAASVVIASTSVVAGIVYYAFQIRHQTRLRETDLLMRLYSAFLDRAFQKDKLRVFNSEFQDYDDFVRRYGLFYDEKPEEAQELKGAFSIVLNQMELWGQLLKRKIVSVDFMYQLYPAIRLWEKVKPVVEGIRKELNDPTVFSFCEYYCNAMKQRQQELHQSKP